MIRKATISDLDEIMDIYSLAREFMKKNNNPNQWGDTYPSRELIEDDVNKGVLNTKLSIYSCHDTSILRNSLVFFCYSYSYAKCTNSLLAF